MAEIKNYLSYEGLSLYNELIKKYIGDADASLLLSITGGELSTDDLSTIKALNDRIKEIVGTLDSGDAASLAAINDELDALATQISGKNVAAEGDDYVSASASDNKVTVSATESTKASLALADSALQKADITAGSVNGTIAVKGEDVEVAGLGSAAYTESDAYAAAVHTHAIADVTGLQTALDGKVDAVDGSRLMTDAEGTKLAGIEAGAQVNVQADWNETDENSDEFIKNKPANLVQDADYVHTDNNFTTDLKTKLEGIEEGAEVNYIKSVGDNLAVDSDGNLTVTIPEATVTGVDETTVDGLKLQLTDKKVTLVDDGLANTLTSKDITLTEAATATDGYLKTYVLKQGTTEVGKIDLPKELVVTGGEVITATDEVGLIEGEKYLKLTIANQDTPVYIAVKDLVDVYTGGAGIAISNTNEVSIALNPTQGNVALSTDGGLKANLEGWETVQSASHTHDNKTVLDGITSEKVAAWDAKQDEMVAITEDEIADLFTEETSEE